MEKSTLCMDSVAWREVGEEPTPEFWLPNETCPQSGEIRWARIDHDFQIPLGERIWMLYQSGESLANGWPEPPEEIENTFIVEVKILEQERLKKRVSYEWLQYWAKVECLQTISIKEIDAVFPESKPFHWPRENAHVGIFETTNFNYYYLHGEGANDWFVTTNSNPERMILRGEQIYIVQEGMEICNCVFDRKAWPHKSKKVEKQYRRK